MARPRHRTFALILGALLIALWLVLPAGAVITPTPVFDSKGPEEAAFPSANAVKVSPDGRIWLTSPYTGQLVKINPDCATGAGQDCAEYFAGSGNAPGQLLTPWGLAFFGNAVNYLVYVTEYNANRVSVFNQGGVFQYRFGAAGMDPGQFFGPTGITVDDTGQIYVSDTANGRVQRFIAGFDGVGDPPPVIFATFANPAGLLFDAASPGPGDDRIFAVSSVPGQGQVRQFDLAGAETGFWEISTSFGQNLGDIAKIENFVYVANTYAGNITRKDLTDPYSWETFSPPPPQLGFASPSGVAILPGTGEMLVSEERGWVRAFDGPADVSFTPDLTRAFGTYGTAPGRFAGAAGVVSKNGIVYVADADNRRVQLFSAATGAFIAAWNRPWLTLPDDPEPVFSGPRGMALGPDGDIYVADPNASVIVRFQANYTGDGDITPPFVFNQGSGDPTPMVWPYDVAVDESETIYVANGDTGNIEVYRLLLVDDNPEAAIFLGEWFVSDWLNTVAVDGDIIYANDSNGDNDTIRVYRINGNDPVDVTLLGVINTPSILSVDDIVVDSLGRIIVADGARNQFTRIDVNTTVFGFVVEGSYGSTGSDMGQLYSPGGLFLDPEGMLYVADSDNNRYQAFFLGAIDPEEPSPEPEEDDDNDNIPNVNDNCPNRFNPNQLDLNNNSIGDICEFLLAGTVVPTPQGTPPLPTSTAGPPLQNDGPPPIPNTQGTPDPNQQKQIADATATANAALKIASDATATAIALANTNATATASAIANNANATATANAVGTAAAVGTANAVASAAANSPNSPNSQNNQGGNNPNASANGTGNGNAQGNGQTVPGLSTPGLTPVAGITSTPTNRITPTPTPTSRGAVAGTTGTGSDPEDRPELISEVLDAREINTQSGTIAANIILALILLMLLVDASIFNSTIKENEEVIMGFFGGIAAPLRGMSGMWTGSAGENLIAKFGKPLFILGISALTYCLLEPGLTLDTEALVLFASLAIGLGVATYVYEGSQVVVSEKMFGLSSDVKFYPVAIFIALISVVVSKVTGLHPGMVYGFVAGAAFLSHRDPEKHEAGMIIFFPMLAMLFVAITAWLLLGPIRSVSDDGDLWALILEGAFASIFLGGIQGLLFALIPLSFMDGQKIWQWSKWAWLAITFPVAFLFFHVVLKQDGTLRSAMDDYGITALIIFAVISWTMTGLTWGLFKWRQSVAG